MGKMRYKFLEHTADIKFIAFGSSLEGAFENSAIAMFKAMYNDKVKTKIKKKIMVKGNNLESLLYNFLEELLFLLDSTNFFASKLKVKIDKSKMLLESVVFGDNASNYKISLQVKAVTYNEMIIKKIKGKWMCQVVLDV
ncbi:MAG: archease [Candidatus Pacearchaeota archaeon]